MLIYGMVFIILATQTLALSIDNTSYVINVFKDKSANFSLVFNNEENETIHDVQVQDINYFDFPIISSMSFNQSREYPFSVYVNKTIDTTLSTKLLWHYRELLETDEETYFINITDSGFEPNEISIDANDNIVFKNIDSDIHIISEFNDEFTFTLNPQQQYNFSFDVIDEFIVIDENTGHILDLNITNKSTYQNVHYSNKDIPITFRLIAKYPSSSLDIDIYTTDFTVDYNGYVDGVLQVTANDDTFGLKFSLPWTTFSSNNFPLAKDQSKIITFRIQPDIDKTSQTNKTYNHYLNISSLNTPLYQNLIKVNIPYAFLGDEDTTKDYKIIKIFDVDACYDYCEEYPDNCPLRTEIRKEYIVRDKNITLSDKQINDMLAENQRLRNKLDEQTSQISKFETRLTDFESGLSGDIDYLKKEQIEETKTQENRNISVGIVIVSAIIIILLGSLFFFIPRVFSQFKSKKFKEHGLL